MYIDNTIADDGTPMRGLNIDKQHIDKLTSNITIMKTCYKYELRHDITNKKYWVFDVYFNGREYPNLISGRYNSKKSAFNDLMEYIHNDKNTFFGNV